jgi:chemotaxis protein MotB
MGLLCAGCVTQANFDALQTRHDQTSSERDGLIAQVDRLTLERSSLEDQYVGAQESYEDERLHRARIARDLARSETEAARLDRDLEAERRVRIRTAATLAERESQLVSVQSIYGELVGNLESELSAGQIEIERVRDGIQLNVSQDVLFASGSAKFDQIGRDVLVKVAGRLAGLTDFIEVRGHTDDRKLHGALAKLFPSNWELAAARAASVVRLLEEHGVPGERLAAISLGEKAPSVPNDSDENRARNRRIEIRLIPAPSGSTKVSPEIETKNEVGSLNGE